MFLEERRNQILQWLDEHERSTVNGLASQWRVTRKTRRRQGKVCIPGACHVNSVARMARFPKSDESPMAHSSTSGPGGKGARLTMAASRAGSRVHLVAKVGTEGVSQFAFDHLSSSDIHSFRLYQTDTEPTGSAILDVSQENGENMIAACSGASKTLTDAGIAGLTHAFTEADVLLLPLFRRSVWTPPAGVMPLRRAGRHLGIGLCVPGRSAGRRKHYAQTASGCHPT